MNTYAYVNGQPTGFVDPSGLAKDSVQGSLEAAIARGDVGKLESLMEALNPAQAQAAREAIAKFGTSSEQWIANFCKGSVNREFPAQFRNKTLGEVMQASQGGDRAAQTAWKLLNDSRFRK